MNNMVRAFLSMGVTISLLFISLMILGADNTSALLAIFYGYFGSEFMYNKLLNSKEVQE